MNGRPDVVFDCNVLFQALARANGPAARCLAFLETQRITLHLSRAVLQELRLILEYPEIREKNPSLTPTVIDAFIERLCFRANWVRQVPHVFDFPRDPADEPYIDLAAAVNADYLVTRDNDLLSLMTDHSSMGNDFRRKFPSLKVVGPIAFVDAILS
jgi:putative PIN family toxin of toxin-antitoxin system